MTTLKRAMTPEEKRLARNAYSREWKRNHPELVKKYNKICQDRKSGKITVVVEDIAPMSDEDRMLQLFKEQMAIIWENSEILDTTKFVCRISRNMTKTLAQIGVPQYCHPYSVGQKLMVAPVFVKLTVSAKVLKMEDARILAIIKHEVIHLGVWNHGPMFVAMAKKYGATINGRMDGETLPKRNIVVQVQLGRGTRFQTVKQVKDEQEGRALGAEIAKTCIYKGRYVTGLRLHWEY